MTGKPAIADAERSRSERAAGLAAATEVDGGRQARRRDPRAERTIEKIVAAAQVLMTSAGTAKLTASEVCEAAGVSRGSLYRYFSSMEDVLETVALRLRTQTDRELAAALEGLEDPSARLEAFIDYTSNSLEKVQAANFLHVEPAFVLNYFEKNFDHFIARVDWALEPVFTAWEAALGAPLDRTAVCEVIVRHVLSETLVAPRGEGPALIARLRAMVDLVLKSGSLPANSNLAVRADLKGPSVRPKKAQVAAVRRT